MGLCSRIPIHPLLHPHPCPQFPKQSKVSASIKTILPHANCYCQAPWFYFLPSPWLSDSLMEIVPNTLHRIRLDQWYQWNNLTMIASTFRLKKSNMWHWMDEHFIQAAANKDGSYKKGQQSKLHLCSFHNFLIQQSNYPNCQVAARAIVTFQWQC